MVPEGRRNHRSSRRATGIWDDNGSSLTNLLKSPEHDVRVVAAGTALLDRQVTTFSILETSTITTYYTTHTYTVPTTLFSFAPTPIRNASTLGWGRSRTTPSSTLPKPIASHSCASGAGANGLATCNTIDGASARRSNLSPVQQTQSTPSPGLSTRSNQPDTHSILTPTMTSSKFASIAALGPSTSSATLTTPSIASTALLSSTSFTLPTSLPSTFETRTTKTNLFSQSAASILPSSIESPTGKYSTSVTFATSKIATSSSAQPTTQNTSSASEVQHNLRPSSGTILGVAVGGTAALVILLLLIIFVLRRRRFSRSNIDEVPKLPPMSAHGPLIVPLPASVDPRNDGWAGSVNDRELGPGSRAPRQQTAITASGLRLVPREEPPPMVFFDRPPPSATHARSESGNHLAPMVPIRNPLRRPLSATIVANVRASNCLVTTSDTLALISPSAARSRASSQNSFDSRTESVYSIDTHGRRRRSDPFSWQNIVPPRAQK